MPCDKKPDIEFFPDQLSFYPSSFSHLLRGLTVFQVLQPEGSQEKARSEVSIQKCNKMERELVIEIKSPTGTLDFVTIHPVLIPWEIMEFLRDSFFIYKMTSLYLL